MSFMALGSAMPITPVAMEDIRKRERARLGLNGLGSHHLGDPPGGYDRGPVSDEQAAGQQASQWEAGLNQIVRWHGRVGRGSGVIAEAQRNGAYLVSVLGIARSHWAAKRAQSGVYNRLYLAADRGHGFAQAYVENASSRSITWPQLKQAYVPGLTMALAEFKNAASVVGRAGALQERAEAEPTISAAERTRLMAGFTERISAWLQRTRSLPRTDTGALDAAMAEQRALAREIGASRLATTDINVLLTQMNTGRSGMTQAARNYGKDAQRIDRIAAETLSEAADDARRRAAGGLDVLVWFKDHWLLVAGGVAALVVLPYALPAIAGTIRGARAVKGAVS